MAMPAEVCAVVAGFVELFPGIPANKTNLETLLYHIIEFRNYAVPCEPSLTLPRLYFTVMGPVGDPELCLDIYEPSLLVASYREDAAIMKRFIAPCTAAGLLTCIAEGKAALKAGERGLCEPCRLARYPSKRLKAPGSEVCIECAKSALPGR
jgi:hypothetical protein